MKNPKPAVISIIANASKTPVYTPAKITNLMSRFDFNEKAFALLMNVTPMTVRLWTSGAAVPCGTSNRLMQIFDACPELAAEITGGTEERK